MRVLVIILILVQFFISCRSADSNSVNGVWQSIGHGKILEIIDISTYKNYDITSFSCFPVGQRKFDEIIPNLFLKNDTLILKQGPFIYEYLRLVELPDLCQNYNPSKASDAIYNFEVFMQTVKENYAIMELNKINWNQLYEKQRVKLNSSSTRAELYLLLEETYDLLNDNHAFLNAPDKVYDEVDKIAPEENNPDNDLPVYGDFSIAQMVAQHHLQEDITKNSGIISWGKLTDDIGFIQIKAMWLFGELDIPDALIESEGFVNAYGLTWINMLEANYMAKEVEGVNKIMRQVMNDLSSMKSIVIDVRFNGGGQEVVSYAILSYFNSKKIQIATEEYRYGDQLTIPQPIFIDGKDNAYTNPVYILTSPQSGSGAEIFAIASMALPHIKRIGSATEGATSTTLDKKLPNGWDFTVSSNVYRDNSGRAYENIGVPVDYELNYIRGDRQAFFRSVANDLDQDKREILYAIENLQMK